MKWLYGDRVNRIIFKVAAPFILFWIFLPGGLQATYFCGCTPKNYQDFRIYVAPQIARLKFQVQSLAIYRGVFHGGSFGLEYRPFCSFYGGFFADWMMGDCDSEMSMSRYIHDIDGQARFGYSLPMWNFYKMTITAFSGLGYSQVVQYLRQDLVIEGEKYHYYNYYVPVGSIIDFRINRGFGFGFLFEWKITLNEMLKTPYLQGVRFNLKRKNGYQLEVPFRFFLGAKTTQAEIDLVPYLTYKVDGALHAKLPNEASLDLPKQDYKFWGLRLNLGVAF
ncbi:MAG: hypothetical protein FJZ63_00275 [Chlamydiae bacterium]|nr:hypothetical protein [Chlamydiota bacterium]